MNTKILKDAIVDGYFKTFDLGNRYSIGRASHDDFSIEDMLSYYKYLGIMMIVTFITMLSLVSSIIYFASIGNELLMYISLGIYLVILFPMIFFGFETIRSWLK